MNKTNGFNQYPDHLLLPDEHLKKITNKFYNNHGKIEVVGHPAFENVNLKYRKKCDKILIIDQPLSENNLTLGYTEFDFYKTMIKFLKLNSIDFKNVDIVVHPFRKNILKSKLPDFKNYVYSPINFSYNLVVGMFSSLMIYEFLSGSNVVSFQPKKHCPDPCPLSYHKKIKKFHSLSAFNVAFKKKQLILKKSPLKIFDKSLEKLSKILLFENS